jgi:single-strand DNA-binding protein
METAEIVQQLEDAAAALRAGPTPPPAPVMPAPRGTVTLSGSLTREPEIRYTREGIATCLLGLAVTDWTDGTESTGFFDVVAWKDLAENCALSLTKGMWVTVAGRLLQRTWEDDDGETHSRVEIEAADVGASLRFATVDVHKTGRSIGV